MYSVIIRIRNEEQHIGQSIQSCIDFLGNPEIVIVNDNSTDKSMYICRLFISNNKSYIPLLGKLLYNCKCNFLIIAVFSFNIDNSF